MPTINEIKATRKHSAVDRATIETGRVMQRRLRSAIRQCRRSRLITLSKRLQHWRRGGFPNDLQWFLSDYTGAINTEISFITGGKS